jgi:hypothetical protein
LDNCGNCPLGPERSFRTVGQAKCLCCPEMAVSAGIAFFFGQLGKLLFAPGSHFSLTSLACALLIATAFFVWHRVCRRRRVRARTILRALFPKRILHSRSNEADIGYLFFNVFVLE